MGEYAKYQGSEIKIGTCENMYYLRADQRHLIEGYDFAGCLGELRFRFPFPDEDANEPGAFEELERGWKIPGAWKIPDDFEHAGSVQFSARPGYLLSLPCPEGSAFEATGLHIGRNGFDGGYEVRYNKFVDGEWWIVVACRSCGEMWRLPREIAATVAEAFIEEAERTEYRRVSSDWDEAAGRWGDSCNYGHEPVHGEDHRAYLLAMASRILAGYTREEVTPSA